MTDKPKKLINHPRVIIKTIYNFSTQGPFFKKKKNPKKILCLILEQNKKKEFLPISFSKQPVQAKTLIFEISELATGNKPPLNTLNP